MKDVHAYIPCSKCIFRISEGTGDNLLEEDIAAGYADYVYYDIFNLDAGLDEACDGGMLLTTESVAAKYASLEEAIPDVLELAYGNREIEFQVLG